MARERVFWFFMLGLILSAYLIGQASAEEDEESDPASGEEGESEGEEGEEAPDEAAEGGDEGDEVGGEEEEAEEEEEGDEEEDGDEGEEGGEVEEGDGGEAESEESEDDEEGSAEGSGEEEEMNGSEALAEAVFECQVDGMDENTASCLEGLNDRVKTLEQAVLSGKGGGLADQITLVLVSKGVVDCDNDTQCSDDRACIDSYEEPGRKMCERPCDRTRCDVPFSECVTTAHKPRCECKEEFHGNGSVACIPKGFEEKNNSRSYRMFDDRYVTFENASQTCQDLGARLPVLDSQETIDVVTDYLETYNFSVFEEWGRSSRRVWLGLVMDRGAGLTWADGQRIISYPASARLFIWEARRMLSQEVSYADSSRHYALYIDGDLAKLPGGGRKGAAVLCELVPSMLQEPYDPYKDYRYNQQDYRGGSYPNYPTGSYPNYPSDGSYPNYPKEG